MGTFLILSFIVGMTVWGFLSFLSLVFSGGRKSGFPKNQNAVDNQKSSNIVEVWVKKTSKKNEKRIDIPCDNYIENQVGISIKKITKQTDRDYTTFYIYVHNLSKKMAPFELLKAFYITSEGEQVEGSVNRLVTKGAENNIILPHLKAEAPITFYKKLSNIKDSDMLCVQLSFNYSSYLLSTHISN